MEITLKKIQLRLEQSRYRLSRERDALEKSPSWASETGNIIAICGRISGLDIALAEISLHIRLAEIGK